MVVKSGGNAKTGKKRSLILRIFDAHVHLFDCKVNTYAFLEHEDRSFKAIAGDYSTLPRRYPTDILAGTLETR